MALLPPQAIEQVCTAPNQDRGFEVYVNLNGKKIQGFVSRERLNESFKKAMNKYAKI